MTTLLTSLAQYSTIRRNFSPSTRVGFVPTMGNLHPGHESLLVRSKEENDISILSIFVNPTQFNNKNDLRHYPRTLEADIKIAKKYCIDYILAPSTSEIYPDDYKYKVQEHTLSSTLEGEHRPSHFDGVLTVVMKLLNLTKAHRAYFGEKDFQQLHLIQGMVNAFFLDVEIVPCKCVRDQSGLPLSSRHNLLSSSTLSLAREITLLLHACPTIRAMKDLLVAKNISFDYIKEWQNRIFVAFTLDGVRLIDNWKMVR